MPKHRNIHQELISHIKVQKYDANGFFPIHLLHITVKSLNYCNN